MEIGTKKWHESVPDFVAEIGAMAGFLGIVVFLAVAFAIEHHLHPR
jgi:hypothetical protein